MFCGFTRERGHFEREFLDNPLEISKTTLGKDDPYKGPLIPPIGFWIPEKLIFFQLMPFLISNRSLCVGNLLSFTWIFKNYAWKKDVEFSEDPSEAQ
jgi:hypothetical protein